MTIKDVRSPTIQVLERSFALLDLLALHQEPVSLKEISARTGLHPSTAHRILNDLTIGRLVDRPQAGTYRLGMRLLELGNLVKQRLDVREAALGPMRELHKLTHQAVNLSMRQGDEIIYVERSYSERSGMQVVRTVGGRAPLHLTSVGKLFLAHDEPARVRSYAVRTGLTGHTRNSMAAGIFDDQGKLLAGLSISAPAGRLEEPWLERVRATAGQISSALGYRG